ncbi:hypothetical protein [Thioclava dalianensis]|uniref:hypothetical protein n=1 Tax=Thioclava dalianensis TaxID=1185766 RepID=UPI0011602A84|nr:hypothetical protein [Thioclava dalianensis]
MTGIFVILTKIYSRFVHLPDEIDGALSDHGRIGARRHPHRCSAERRGDRGEKAKLGARDKEAEHGTFRPNLGQPA